MTERGKLEAWEKKQQIYYAKGGICEVCQKPVTLQECQLAHRISKGRIKEFGKEIIHHEKNLALTCGDKFGRCNDACNIGNNPMKTEALVSEIMEEL